ncbi:MAG: glutathione S-transferase family protein [Pseudomonadota bacterium]
MLTLYSMPSSGNSYKVRLLLAKLNLPFKHIAVEYDGENTATRTAEFRALNPAGKVPLLILENGETLAESNAILHYLGEGTRFMPQDRLQKARMLRWMFWEQNAHETSVAVRRATFVYPNREMDRSPARMADLLASGHGALDVMETHLKNHDWLAGETITLADLCLYAYTAGCEIGGFDLAPRPAVTAWLKRVESDADHVSVDWIG